MLLRERHWVYDRFNIKIVVPPTTEQLSLADARDHLRLIPYGSPPRHPEDAWLNQFIPVAREWCEGEGMLSFVPQTLELRLGRFPGAFNSYYPVSAPGYLPHPLLVDNEILLPMGPIVSVESVLYGDVDSLQTLDSGMYFVDSHSRPPVLHPRSGMWPTMSGFANAVVIRYQVGFSIVGSSPQTNPFPWSLMAAMKLVLGHLFLNRENTSEIKLEDIPINAQALISRYSAKIGFA